MEEKTGFSNIEQIKEISRLMGGKEADGTDILKMMETANQVKQMMSLFQSSSPQEKPPDLSPHAEELPETKAESHSEAPPMKEWPESKGEGGFSLSNRQEKMIDAAIPFLDRDYQKNLYVVVRLMEIRRVMRQGELLESRSRTKDDPAFRRRKLLQAVRPFLNTAEKHSIDSMMKVMDMRHIVERKEE